RFRAGFDFLRLRADSGEVAEELVSWWQQFSLADEERRSDMLDQLREEQRQRSRQRKSGPARTGTSAPAPAPDASAEGTAEPAPRKRRRRRRKPASADGSQGTPREP